MTRILALTALLAISGCIPMAQYGTALVLAGTAAQGATQTVIGIKGLSGG